MTTRHAIAPRPLFTLHPVNEEKVPWIAKEMLELGPPTIRVVDMGAYLAAIEGCHRVEVAARLGLPLRLDFLDPQGLVSGSSLDWSDLDPDSDYLACWLGAEVRCGREPVEYQVTPDGHVRRSGSVSPVGLGSNRRRSDFASDAGE